MQQKQLTIGFFEEVYNKRNFEFVSEHFAENYYEHTPEGARSNEDCRTIIEGACKVFPDIQVEINDIIAEENLISARVTFKGTHMADFFGIPKTKKMVTFEAMEFFKLKNGKFTESWGSWPIHDILQQLR